MSITRRFLSEDNETQSIDVPFILPRTEPISRTEPELAEDAFLSPREAARDEHEKTIKHTMPDDPHGDFA
ncbi:MULTISPECIES: hypothetical protein [Paraburkholderia]|jgi:hypothetical protein|uniref:Uncharacterized protein n=2 Tax=Paraburkholderia TaxID=1822464 RepID=A0ABP2PA83_9BURK|nr:MULTISPECIES: hypothetical protein [Paraburkholderia]AUT66345.1 hypothetical protein C2L65_42270 [Paraburkholderia terrae]EIM94523.1 hypothetical protein WQE_43774 [Paraburkholderia hospita]OUL83601.1 hypothetical protein CA602_21835 [Paraburkholderia hospita]OUL85465.1 hypothetical protein CA603_23490 [Paraburkholderia hospita]OUL96586.1 hypothetical protein CA601_01980 [Paraburkholderia hospita]